MSDWSAGYVADIEYLPGFYREQAPGHLYLACLLNGVEPPDLARGFDYCELGCGTGVTVGLLAAANPHGRFHAVDFHPAHIARAEALKTAAGLDNLAFHEASFEEMAAGAGPALPAFDMVTLHGVYSWVSPENRRAIVRFLRDRVKPGGIVAVSYNALPGWNAARPLQRLLYEYSRLVPGRSDRQIAEALGFARRIQAASGHPLGTDELMRAAGEAAAGPTEADRLVYLAHEYLNGSWEPLYHADVARDLADAKLTYVGSASLLESFPQLALTPEQCTVLEGVPDPVLRETFRDYCARRPFRRDVFVRGTRRLTEARRDALLRALTVALVLPRSDARTTVEIPLGEARLERAHYEPIFDALADGPRTVADLVGLAGAADGAGLQPQEVAGMLVGSHQAIASPHGPAPDGPLPSVLRFNRAQAGLAGGAVLRKTTGLAASVGGSGLHASMVETLLYDALASGVPAEVDQVVDHALDRILGTDGARAAAASGNAEALGNRTAVAESVTWCLNYSVPLWRTLGMI